MSGKIKVTLVRSKNHRSEDTLATLQTLGLKKVNSSRVIADNPATRGICAKLAHMVKIEEVKS
jgi:large subunit ribosomal protein L30